jgi:predicted MFS family arabinose efflux permease
MEVSPPSPHRWVVALVVLPLRISIGLNVFAPAPLFPIMMDHHDIGRGTVSLMVTSVFLVLTFFLIPGGTIVARIGTRRACLLGGLLMSSGLLMGVAPTFTLQVALRVVFGLGAAIMIPASAAILGQWMKPQERGPLAAIYLMGESGGVAFAMFIGVATANVLGWENVFAVYAGFALVSTVAWGLLGRQAPVTTSETTSFREVLGMLRERRTLLLSFAGVGPIAMFISFASWLPTYYNEAFGMELERATRLAAVMPLTGTVMNGVAAVILGRFQARKPVFVITGIAAPILGYGTFLFFNVPLVIVSVVLLSTVFWLFLPTLFTIPLELPDVRPENVGIMLSGVLTLGNGAAVLAPFVVGATTDALGSYVPSLSVLAIFPVTALVSAAFLREIGGRRVGNAPTRASE